jgi:hypothetical protein
MTFLKSIINQVGRDTGKVISNQIFKNSHSTPIRMVSGSYSNDYKKVEKEYNSVKIDLSQRPPTIIRKLNSKHIYINTLTEFVSDGYLDLGEADLLFKLMGDYYSLCDDILEVLSIDEEKNKKEIEQLSLLSKKTTNIFAETLESSIKGCQTNIDYSNSVLKNPESINSIKFMLKHIFYMGKYANGEAELNIFKVIIANVLAIILIFPIGYVFTTIYGFKDLLEKKKSIKNNTKKHKDIVSMETKRIQEYKKTISNLKKINW